MHNLANRPPFLERQRPTKRLPLPRLDQTGPTRPLPRIPRERRLRPAVIVAFVLVLLAVALLGYALAAGKAAR
jgi:hypothetical protein